MKPDNSANVPSVGSHDVLGFFSAWLIERDSPAEYWVSGSGNGDGTMAHEEWTSDPYRAARFNECGAKQHAKELEQWGVKGPLRACDHLFNCGST